MTQHTSGLHRLRRHRHSLFVERAMATYKAFEYIDKRFPLPKFRDENEHWAHQVHAILADQETGNEDKIDKLLSLLAKVSSK